MKSRLISCISLLPAILFCLFTPQWGAAQDQVVQEPAVEQDSSPAQDTTPTQDSTQQKTAPRELWSLLQEGKLSVSYTHLTLPTILRV